MPILLLSLVVLLGVCGWLVDGWLSGHALAVASGGQWEIVTSGWGLFLSLGGPLAAFGLLAGVVLGVLAGSRLLGLLAEKQGEELEATRHALSADRLKIEAQKSALDAELRKVAAQARKEAAETAQEAAQARFEAEDRARATERRLKATEGRLKGAQQKAARMQKKAQLTRGNAPKPA